MKFVKMKLILLLAVARFIEAGPHFDDTMKDVNSLLVVDSASPELYPASEEDPKAEVTPATEDFFTGEAEDLIISRKRRRSFKKAYKAMKKEEERKAKKLEKLKRIARKHCKKVCKKYPHSPSCPCN